MLLMKALKPGDVVLILSAGDAYQISDALIKETAERSIL